MSTIFALASARGKSGVAVIRVSGPAAHEIGRALAGSLPSPGRFAVRDVRRADGALIDQALILCFSGPHSFTGEDVVELQLHGSRAVVDAVEAAILATGLALPAEAGEFTRRALLNDKMDLAQVEGLGELLAAETEAQRAQAMALLSGRLHEVTEEWRDRLVKATALLEATIDFADEEIPDGLYADVLVLLQEVTAEIAREIEGSFAAERIKDGVEVALVGPPNAGKSTLLNYIAQREVAITSETAGTTRDVLEVSADLKGFPVTFLDMAGLRETSDTVEAIGVARARERALKADLRIGIDADASPVFMDLLRDDDIRVRGKADVVAGADISGVTGEGVDALLAEVAKRVADRLADRGTATNARHRAALQTAVTALTTAQDALCQGHFDVEIVAEDVRRGVQALDALIGRVDVEDVLGKVFSEFCIGK